MSQLGSRDEAEDAVQSTFLNAHRALRRGVEPEAEVAWLFKIAHNVCLTRRRSSRRRGRVESPSDLGAVQDFLPAPARESADELIRLTDALAHMPDSQRRAIVLREWQGLSYREIAGELGLSQSAVETLIFRARRSLAANLEVEPVRPTVLARARKALDVGTILMAAKALFEGGAAVKVAATAVAVSGTAVVATSSSERAPTPVHAAPPAIVGVAPVPAAPKALSASTVGAALSARDPVFAEHTRPARVPKTAAAEPTPAPTTSAVAQAANEPPAASAPEPEAAPRQSHPAAAESAKVERSKVKGPEGASERPWGTTKSAPPRSQPLVAEPAAKAPVEPGEKNGIGDPEAARANGQGGNGKEKGNGRADE